MQIYFYNVNDYAEKKDLSKGYWNPKENLDTTTHFSEIVKLQPGKKATHFF